ncbi:MAG TPA: DUF5947 family protein [Acidimicrobiales bacterium]
MTTTTDPLEVLSRIRRSVGDPARDRPAEVCELCGVPVEADHGHVVDIETRRLMCSCRGCYLLFTDRGAGGGHFRAVPTRYVAFDDLGLGPAEWEALQIPVSVAFFFLSSNVGRVCAFYPGPAGATESLLPLETWAAVVTANPELGELEPDVEAFLVRSERSASTPECFLVPIDACYRLVGELRRSWRGFDGGREAHDSLDAFFEEIRARAERGRP